MGLFDKFIKKEKNIEKSRVETIFSEFLNNYSPSGNLQKPSKELIEECRKYDLPEEIIEFWNLYGFGNYGNGILKVINPEEYKESLYTWLGNENPTRIPIFMTGFGDLIYYRKLEEDEYDFSVLDIHYRQINVCAWSLEDFLQDFINLEEIKKDVLKAELFEEARKKSGELKDNEIYFFVPALILGGGEAIKYVDKGDAPIHHSILLQLGE